jgi:two-component system alkaline phosphatase synthesis response regulator PhoP
MGRPKILLVDDNQPVLQCRQLMLEQQGFSVLTADSGLGALRIAEAERPDLVVSDIKMVGMDGYELCRKIRKLYGVPVILYSAYDINRERLEAAKSVDAAVVMTSACQLGELPKTIRSLLPREETEMDPAPPAGVVSAVPSPAARGPEPA